MKRLLFAFVITLIIKFCSFTQPVVFPLNHGDYWGYNFFTAKIIGDTVLEDGFSYYIQEQSKDVYRYYAYFRQSGDSVFHATQLVFNFSLSPGDTVSSILIGNDTSDFILTETGVDTFLGRQLRYWIFLRNALRHYEGDESYYTIVDSIGIMKLTGNGSSLVLLGAVISGITYGAVTTVEEKTTVQPFDFLLNQNYPNPFNPSTVIRYQLSTSSFVTLKIYNSFGQEVASLLNEQKPAGEYSVPFNAERLPSGVYVYRLNAVGNNQTYTQSRKMIYLK